MHLAAGSIDYDPKIRSKSHFNHSKEKLEALNTDYLEDRSILRFFIIEDRIDEALAFFLKHEFFSKVYSEDVSVRATFDCLRFLRALKIHDLARAIKLA